MRKIIHVVIAALCSQLILSACDTPFALNAHVGAQNDPLRATLVSSSSGQTLRVLQLDKLPAPLRDASEIRAILDNSTATYPVQRNADGTLSIPLPTGRQPDSKGIVEIMLTDGQKSWLLSFDTGPLLDLADPPIQIGPTQRVVLGTGLDLKAQFADKNTDTSAYTFTWSAASSAQGPWMPISGTESSVRWHPVQAGNYFLRLETRASQSGAVSVFTTPAPVVFVQAPDQIALTDPADGQILAGDEVQLKANIPEAQNAEQYLWAYSQSAVGPFQPIAGQGAELSWEPPVAGSYYLRLQIPQGQELDTYTSSKALVVVSDADDLISTQPASGEVTRGQSLRLQADIPGTEEGTRYLWSFASSPQGSFTAIAAEGQQIQWLPNQTGEFYMRVRTIAPDGNEKTYTSAKVLVSVRDSDAVFDLQPNPANLVKGQSVILKLKDVSATRQLNWFYGFSAQRPFQSIPGQGQNLSWSPPLAGSFFLRAEVTGGGEPNATYTSASALVNVTESNSVVSAAPSGAQRMGTRVLLKAQTPEPIDNAIYTWSVGPSPVGPWFPAQTLDSDPTGSQIAWYPGQEGAWYVKVDVARPEGGSVLSFTSPRALVFSNNSRDFFHTNPNPANIGTQGAVELSANFSPPAGELFTYAWSYGPSAQGPFVAMGASSNPNSFTWLKPGVAGSYHIKLDVISNSSGRVISFVSSNPLVFVGESQ